MYEPNHLIFVMLVYGCTGQGIQFFFWQPEYFSNLPENGFVFKFHISATESYMIRTVTPKDIIQYHITLFPGPVNIAEYIKYLFKTVRKFFGEAIVVTQEVEDIISSPVVKQAIINNSDCKILLDQSKYQNKFDQIQEMLGLTEKEKALVLSVNKANDPSKKYKEVFISLGGVSSKVYRTEVSLEEYLAYTTEESEKVKLQQYAARFGGDIKKGIEAFAKEIREKQ